MTGRAIVLAALAMIAVGLASADVTVYRGRDAKGEVPPPVGSWRSNPYAEWINLDLEDPQFMSKQKTKIKKMVAVMAPKRFREILLTICEYESGFVQFDRNGNPTWEPVRGGRTHGAMRISDQPWARYPWIDYERIRWDARYNVECGILIFLDKWITAGRLKVERPGLRQISRIQLAIQLYYGLVPLKPGVDRWKYSRDVIRMMRRVKCTAKMKQD